MIVKRLLLVTPCFNAGKFLKKTFDSVLIQLEEGIQLTYIVCDGASVDDTDEIIAMYEPIFKEKCVDFVYLSEPDSGMYDALSKGFCLYDVKSFDVCAYINAGDFFAPRSFRNVLNIISGDVSWVTGINVKYNINGDIVAARLPGSYPSYLIKCGMFGRLLPCIQQESTFWSGLACSSIDFYKLKSYKLAGDFFMWQCLAKSHKLYVAPLWLSGFTVEPGQLSEVHRKKYFDELRAISERCSFFSIIASFFVGFAWLLPDALKKKLFKSNYV